MIGLGVGIDYALFIITRHRAGLQRGLTVEDAVGRAIATAGQSVIIAGGTVVIAIMGLAVAGIPMVTYMGFGAALVVAIMVIAAAHASPRAHRASQGTTSIASASPACAGSGDRARAAPTASTAAGPAGLTTCRGTRSCTSSQGSPSSCCSRCPSSRMRLGQTDASQNPTSSTLRRSYDLARRGLRSGLQRAADPCGRPARLGRRRGARRDLRGRWPQTPTSRQAPACGHRADRRRRRHPGHAEDRAAGRSHDPARPPAPRRRAPPAVAEHRRARSTSAGRPRCSST